MNLNQILQDINQRLSKIEEKLNNSSNLNKDNFDYKHRSTCHDDPDSYEICCEYNSSTGRKEPVLRFRSGSP